jgi:hypothetical protein
MSRPKYEGHAAEGDLIAGGEIVQHIPVSVASFTLGLLGLAFGAGGYVPMLYLLPWVSIPLSLLLFLLAAILTIGAGREGEKAIIGVLLGLGGVVAAALQLLLDPLHPWIGS